MTTTSHDAPHTVVATHGWRDLFFLHWAWPAEHLLPLIPEGLVLDRHEGEAWLTVAPMRMEHMRPRGFPEFLGLSFLEVNVRTYVRGPAGRGMFFLSIETSSTMATVLAKAALGLPYEHARITSEVDDHDLAYVSSRPDDVNKALAVRATKGAEAPRPPSTPLERFLLDRRSAFMQRGDALQEVVVNHPAVQIRPGTAVVDDLSLLLAAHLGPPPSKKPLVHIAEPIDAEICMPHVVSEARRSERTLFLPAPCC